MEAISALDLPQQVSSLPPFVEEAMEARNAVSLRH